MTHIEIDLTDTEIVVTVSPHAPIHIDAGVIDLSEEYDPTDTGADTGATVFTENP